MLASRRIKFKKFVVNLEKFFFQNLDELKHFEFIEFLIPGNKAENNLVYKDHLGDWSPEKDCCWWLTFWQAVGKPYSQSSVNQADNFIFHKSPVTLLTTIIIIIRHSTNKVSKINRPAHWSFLWLWGVLLLHFLNIHLYYFFGCQTVLWIHTCGLLWRFRFSCFNQKFEPINPLEFSFSTQYFTTTKRWQTELAQVERWDRSKSHREMR